MQNVENTKTFFALEMKLDVGTSEESVAITHQTATTIHQEISTLKRKRKEG